MGNIKNKIKFCLQKFFKNKQRRKDFSLDEHIKLYYWRLSEKTENLGDYLSKVVVSHYMPKNVQKGRKKRKTIYAIGSILGFRCQNAVVWGSGVLNEHEDFNRNIRCSNLDIRAVRGPKTRKIIMEQGKDCPEVYGDPAILMPCIYKPISMEKKYKVSLILHYEHNKFDIPEKENIHLIDIQTTDYKTFIEEVVSSELVISSSLHGIILAEAYGVPAVALLKKEAIVFKFEDYYNSTGREDVIIARTIEEALSTKPMPLPELSKMQKDLMEAFPRDLWK